MRLETQLGQKNLKYLRRIALQRPVALPDGPEWFLPGEGLLLLHLAEVAECRPLRGVGVLAHQGRGVRVVVGNGLDQAGELVRRRKLGEALLPCHAGVVRTEPSVRVGRDAKHAPKDKFFADPCPLAAGMLPAASAAPALAAAKANRLQVGVRSHSQ